MPSMGWGKINAANGSASSAPTRSVWSWQPLARGGFSTKSSAAQV
jgi:hypothetical protein